MATLGEFVRAEFPAEVDTRRFLKLLQSLPTEEQELYRLYRHPAQDKGVVGYEAAKTAASALIAELSSVANPVSAEVAGDCDGWLLLLRLAGPLAGAEHKIRTVYRGFPVRYIKTDEGSRK